MLELKTFTDDANGAFNLMTGIVCDVFLRALTDRYVLQKRIYGNLIGQPQNHDFYFRTNVVTAVFGDDLAKLLHNTIYF